MIRSMTGYGSVTQVRGEKSLTIEIRSLNHRYCEINIRLPKKFFFLENALKTKIKSQLLRGKIDVYITYQYTDGSDTNLTYNKALAQRYLQELHKMSNDLLLENDLTLSHVMMLPDMFISEEEDETEEDLEQFIEETLEMAIEKIVDARQTEGQMLAEDILAKLDEIETIAAPLAELEKQSVEEYRQKITDRLNELLQAENIEESRIITEVAFFADRISIDEEIVRLNGHIRHMREVLKDESGIGKKLDFIVQEMNREANTMSSKAVNMEVKNIAIELKNYIEKIREQIQNIE